MANFRQHSFSDFACGSSGYPNARCGADGVAPAGISREGRESLWLRLFNFAHASIFIF